MASEVIKLMKWMAMTDGYGPMWPLFLPVFVKDGGILPMMDPMLHAPKSNEKVNLEIRHYGNKEGKYLLYDDDGETFDFEKGEYSWREIIVQKNRKGKLEGRISKPAKGKPDNVGKVKWRFMGKDG